MQLGSVIAGHRLDAIAGRGGMGTVYRATQLIFGRTVALKVVSSELASDPTFRQRFEREWTIAASLDHPHVVAVHTAGEDEGVLYISMQWVPGTDLRILLDRQGRLEPARAARIVAQVASGLDAAHASGLVHRDIKPGNVLIGSRKGEEHAYLTDFGLSKHLTSQAGLTRAGEWVGTGDYVAPEEVASGSADARSDVYSLACILFQALTGSVPYLQEHELAKLWAHVNAPPPLPRDRVPDLPAEFDEVIQRGMAKRPEDRYPSAGDLARAALAAVHDERPRQSETSVAVGSAAPRADAPAAHAPTVIRPRVPAAGDEQPSDAPLPRVPTLLQTPPPSGPASTPPFTQPSEPPALSPDAPSPRLPQSGEPPDMETGAGSRPRRRRAAAAAGLLVGLVTLAAVLAVVLGGPGGGGGDGGTDARSLPVGKGAADVALADRSLWVAGIDDSAIRRVNPGTEGVAGAPVKIGDGAKLVAADGAAVWVGVLFENRVTRVDARTGRPTGATVRPIEQPTGLAVGHGALWVTTDTSVQRYQALTGKALGRRINVGNGVADVAVDSGGAWIVSEDAGTLTRVSGADRVAHRTPVGKGANGVAAGEGAVWVANGDAGTVTRVDAASGTPSGKPVRIGSRADAVATGGGGVWALDGSGGRVVRLDPRAGRPAGRPVRVPRGGTALVVDGRRLWIANPRTGSIDLVHAR